MNEGVFSAPRGFLNGSTALGDANLAEVAQAITRALEAVAGEPAWA